MNRFAIKQVAALVARRAMVTTGRVTARSFVTAAPVSTFNVIKSNSVIARSFSQATEKPAPFLDTKDVTARVLEVVKQYEKVNAAKLTATARFKEDLELDSLDAVEVVMAIEEEFCIEIPDSEADKILSVADAISYISTHPMAK